MEELIRHGRYLKDHGIIIAYRDLLSAGKQPDRGVASDLLLKCAQHVCQIGIILAFIALRRIIRQHGNIFQQ